MIAVPVANAGRDPRGPGTGAGGVGDGTGSGGDGDGDGGGGYETPPRRIRDGIRSADLPDSFVEIGRSERNAVRFAVEDDGRVTNCRLTRRSRNADLDAVTCPLFERRFRYQPSRDAAGRPVRSIVVMEPGVYGSSSAGHVGWVTSVSGGQITIVEMNALAGPFNYNTRTLSDGPGMRYIYAP